MDRPNDLVWGAQATLLAGMTLLVSGVALAARTADDAPWIGSWLDGVFEVQRWIGWNLLLLGVLTLAVLAAAGWYLAGAPAVDEHELSWLRRGFDAYAVGVVILAVATITGLGVSAFAT